MDIKKLANATRNLIKYRNEVYQYLQFKEMDKQAFDGSVQPNELALLQELVEKANSLQGPIVEVGTLFGFTTQYLALWKDVEKELVTIDNFFWNPLGLSPEAHQSFTNRILHYVQSTSNTRIHAGSNTEYYGQYQGEPPALVFIDAGHDYEDVIVDIKWALEAGVKIISGHDYSDGCPGVVKAVDEYFDGKFKLQGTLWAYSSSIEL